jgi:hypothetical protein
MSQATTVLVRGFDMFFTGADALALENIAKQLGGRYSFNVAEGRASYMFEKIQTVPVDGLKKMHQFIHKLGREYAASQGCTYVASELYITASQDGLSDLNGTGLQINRI